MYVCVPTQKKIKKIIFLNIFRLFEIRKNRRRNSKKVKIRKTY